MLKWITLVTLLGFSLAGTQVEASGCIRGALVGGAAGHLAHHGFLGAAAGCAYGVHRSHQEQMQMQRQEPVQVQQPSNPPPSL